MTSRRRGVIREMRHPIVGGGSTGDAACRGILDVDPEPDPEQILLTAGEYHRASARPPLSEARRKGEARVRVSRCALTLVAPYLEPRDRDECLRELGIETWSGRELNLYLRTTPTALMRRSGQRERRRTNDGKHRGQTRFA
jgi:hypothetical protein